MLDSFDEVKPNIGTNIQTTLILLVRSLGLVSRVLFIGDCIPYLLCTTSFLHPIFGIAILHTELFVIVFEFSLNYFIGI